MQLTDTKRSGKAASPGWGIVVVILLIGVGLTAAYYNGNLTGGVKPGSVVTTGGNGLKATTLPLSFVNNDPFNNITIDNSVIAIYTPQGNYIATCTTSSGTCSTTQSFTSGQAVVGSIETSGYVTEWIPFTIPFVPTNAASLTAIPVSLYEINQSSWVPTFNIGTTIAQAGISAAPFTYNYNFTSTASQAVTVNLNYKTANAGYLGCNTGTGQQYDIINRICQSAVLQMSDTGSGLSVTGMPSQYSSGSTRYWWSILPDGVGVANPSNGGMGALAQVRSPGAGPEGGISSRNTGGSLSEQTIGQNLWGGVATVQFTIQQGSVPSGQNETVIFTLFVNADPNFFPVNNNLGPLSINASTPFSIIWTAH